MRLLRLALIGLAADLGSCGGMGSIVGSCGPEGSSGCWIADSCGGVVGREVDAIGCICGIAGSGSASKVLELSASSIGREREEREVIKVLKFRRI